MPSSAVLTTNLNGGIACVVMLIMPLRPPCACALSMVWFVNITPHMFAFSHSPHTYLHSLTLDLWVQFVNTCEPEPNGSFGLVLVLN